MMADKHSISEKPHQKKGKICKFQVMLGITENHEPCTWKDPEVGHPLRNIRSFHLPLSLLKLEVFFQKGNPPTLLVGMSIDAATMENNMEFPQKN